MKSVMLVDDERPARELLKMMLDWNKVGFDTILEARNGKQALELYTENRPDLIITDIQMPVMDGLEFLKRIKSICPSQKVVILSCHEDFSYARSALKLGVMDYLIKDSLTEETLYNLLKELNVPCDDNNITFYEEPEADSPSIFTDVFLNTDKDAESLKCSAALEFYTKKGYSFFCCLCGIENFSASDMELENLRKELTSCHTDFGFSETVIYHHRYFLILYLVKHKNSQMELANNRFQVLRIIRKELEMLTGCTISIGVSNQSTQPNDLSQLINQSYLALKSKVFHGTGKNLYYNHQYSQTQGMQIDTLNNQIQNIRTSIRNSDKVSLDKNLNLIYKKGLDGIAHYHYLSYVNAVLLEILMENCQKRNLSYETVFGSDTLCLDTFDNMDSPAAVLQWFMNCFEKLFQTVPGENRPYSLRVRNILNYIQSNFQQDISLETIADTFWIHKVYLAKIFKQETGRSVNEYIRNVRIEKAKELLLNEHIKINDIVTACGFNNPQTFYTLFKKYVGMKPGEYREQMTI